MKISLKVVLRFCQIAVLVFGVTALALAQSPSSEVNGTVKDPTGAVIPGVTIHLIDVGTNTETTTTSSGEGTFVFANVRAGLYRIVAEHEGFSKKEIQDVKLDVGVPFTVNIELAAGAVQETVTVSASDVAAPINITNAELSATVQTQQINDLPLNGRNPLDLAGLQPGVAAGGASNRDATINGLRGTFSNLTWDGININDAFIRTDSLFGAAAPSVPGVAEFTLVTQNAGPGDGLGVAQVKLVTPRGGSDFHGSLWEYHRNDAFDANSFFNNANGLPKPKLIRNQFGFGVGGPFVLPRFGEGGPTTFGRNKLFFYGYYEGTRERTDEEVERTTLTGPARSGLFTYSAANGSLQTVNLLTLGGLGLDPITQQLIGLTPLPNDLTGGDTRNFARFRFNSPSGSDDDLWGFRVDLDANSANHFEGVLSRDVLVFPNDTFNDIGEPFPGLPGGGQSPTRTRFSGAWNWIPTATFNNELRGGFFMQRSKFFSDVVHDRGFRINFPLNPQETAEVFTNPVQNFLQQGRNVDTWEIMDNAGKSWGNHFVRFGGNYRLVLLEPFNAGGTIPTVTLGFNDIGTINPLDPSLFPGGIGSTDFTNATNILALLSGSQRRLEETFNATSASSGFLRNQINIQNYRYWNIGPYVGDTWRFRDNLTLNFGLRWEFVSVPKEENGLLALPIGTGLDVLTTNAEVGAASGGGRPLYNNDWNNFAPSFSFAWDPFRDGKTSVRGGYGISYVIDNNITTINNAASRGFTRDVQLDDLTGTLNDGVQSIPVPAFVMPFRIRDVFENEDPFSALFTIDPNLRTPYVQQWNFGIQREIFRDTIAEVRYVGNRGVKLTRGVDINQQRIFNGGFFQDFQRARFNLFNCPSSLPTSQRINPTAAQCPNRQALQVLPGFGAFAFNQGTFQTALRQGEVARALDFFISNKSFFFADFGGGDFGATQLLSTYLANPNTYVADYIGNGSWSNYNALQAEVRRRLSHGFDFQANYTWSKALTDFEGSQTNFSGLLDLTLGDVVEKRRGVNDLTHIFKANAGYELPFGPGKRWAGNGMMSKVLGGMKLTGIFVAQSGRPISFISGRGTLNRTGRSTINTVNSNLSVEELQHMTGLFFDPNTGRPVLFDPALIQALRNDTSPLRDQNGFLSNPGPGTVGGLQLTPVSGPGLWNFDMGFIKRTPITETVNIEFRMEAFNVFNKTNFFITAAQLNQNINNPTTQPFGEITQTYDPRILQFALKLNF
ncbi:MAG TPA: carboxypeptidase regulatory-like domain-containing protein [Pyrinomonadaceae bacterium]|nr:carboxypeptidase regulatory-like domain-containing protein [Pyrinomonadaceae bacterium]